MLVIIKEINNQLEDYEDKTNNKQNSSCICLHFGEYILFLQSLL